MSNFSITRFPNYQILIDDFDVHAGAVRTTDGRADYTLAMASPDAAVRQALDAQHDVRLAVIFGSSARGSMRADSDLDIGVLGLSADRLDSLRVLLERATARDVDVIALETAPPLLRFEIARDGRVLVERTPHLWSDFKARAMVDWWDWAPFARRFHTAAAARLREGLHGPS